MLVGLLSLYAGVFTYPGDLTAGQCAIRPWLIGGGLMLLLGPMLAKLYRLFRILENTSLVQVLTQKEVQRREEKRGKRSTEEEKIRVVARGSLISLFSPQTAISTETLFIYSGVILGIEILFLIIWTAVDRLKPKVTDASSSTESVLVCACSHFWVYM